ncbi:hypothetical protein ABKW00_19960 [Enterobacter hormaechei]
MLETTKEKWTEDAHNVIQKELLHAFRNQNQDSWSENHITTQMLLGLLNIGKDIKWNAQSQRVVWDSFKLKGTNETEFGDIALFAKVMLTSDLHLEGVVFYEAKRQYYDKKFHAIGFNSIKPKQLTRIQKLTSASNVLLYDVDVKNKTLGAFCLPTIFVEKLMNKAPYAVLPHTLPHYSTLWVSSLAENFSGYGLDYSPEAVKKIKELLETSKPPSHIINACFSMPKSVQPKLDNSFIPLDKYENLVPTPTPTPTTKNKPRKNNGMS